MDDIQKRLTAKKQKLDSFKPFPPELIKNLDDWYKVELTYTSNAIEGNTLSRAETAEVVEKGYTVAGKTVTEHLEAQNHARAWDFIKTLVDKKRQNLTADDILTIHKIILTKIDDANAGRYRNVPVRIAGSAVVLPNPAKVAGLMGDFMAWLTSDLVEHPVLTASQAHYKLVTIHPFVDGNGRTARLLMNLLLLQQGYPPVNIKPEVRMHYLRSLEKAQLGDSLYDFYRLILTCEEESLDMYLDALTQSKNPQI